MALKMPLPRHAEFRKLIENAPTSPETRTAFSSWAVRAKTALECQESDITFSDLSAAIPVSEDAGALSLSALAFLFSQGVPDTSTFDILRCYTRLWAGLPEVAKTCQDEYATPALEDVLSQVKSSIGSLPSLFQSESNRPALVDPTSQRTLTHGQLSSFIRDFKLPLAHDISESKPVVVLALPNGYLLGLTLLAVSSYCTSAPINTAGGPQQFRAEAELAKPNAILVLETDVQRLGLDRLWVTEAGIQILVVEPDVETGMKFSVRALNGSQSLGLSNTITPNSADDYALILFTSGTSGTKKVVPVTCLELLTGITCVIDSWGLTPEDSCVNMMPLNHVGGIVRNLFAPVLSGGSTILCPAFDPNSFWDILQDGRGTWYYASPSMHMSILAEGGMRPEALARCRLRLVCNAAGGLLPALAVRLRETFSCIVLPSYGMTECMPISTPPLDYTLTRPGTSGISCGPEIAILDDSDHVLPPGQVGRINVRGGPCFGGYLKGGKIDTSIFNKSGWFDTGDLGSLDEDGYLYLTGRGKEVINRGGELISPFEVEEAITLASQNPSSTLFKRVNQVMAFSAPDDLLQEVVGVALVTPQGMPRPDVRDLQAALKTSLHSSKWPIVVVYINALPTSNNKIVRIKFGERLDLPTITKEMTLAQRHFEAIAPPVNCPLTTKVLKTPCTTDVQFVMDVVQKHLAVEIEPYVGLSHHDGTPEVFLAPITEAPTSIPSSFMVDIIRTKLREEIDGYMFPSKIECLEKPFPRLPSSIIDVAALEQMLKDTQRAHVTAPASETEEQIRRAFSEVLGFDIEEISAHTDFFEMGGDSLSAGRLLSILRRDLQVRIPVDQLFGASKVSEICERVEGILQAEAHTSGSHTEPLPGCTETYSSTNPLVLAINLLPILLFYPMKIGLQWTSLMYALSQISAMWDERIFASKFLALIGAMFISRAATQIVSPLVGIVFKWVVMGKYREGMYPMWGPYHTRWWVTQKVLIICGKVTSLHLRV
jgi:acyl-CoA synthetase (AMP-forming)/AMP-acid ligase II/acyl carrier protein